MSGTLIRNAMIIDGTGQPACRGDLLIAGDRIAEVGAISPLAVVCEQVIDAAGLVLSPGFIDMHSHSDLLQLVNPAAPAKIRQGITTELLGQDGLGAAPIDAHTVADYRKYVSGLLGDPPASWSWRSFGDYLVALEAAGTATNLAVLASHGPIRLAVTGMAEREATERELAAMSELTAAALAEGAFGLSTGLIYPPCVFAGRRELIELAKTTAAFDGIFVVHVRNERGLIKESIREIFAIAAETGVAPHISHLKVIGKENWGTADDILALFDEANHNGLDASFDQYPYPAGSTMLSILIPPHAHAGGPEALLGRLKEQETRQRLAFEMANGLPGWENIATAAGWDKIIVTGITGGPNKRWEGVSLAAIAAARNSTPPEIVFDLLIEQNLQASMVNFSLADSDVARIMQHSRGMLGTDGLLVGKPHPRAYGSTARILGKYVRQDGLLPLEQAIARMTAWPAARLGLKDRGIVRAGMKADLVLFDADKVADCATYIDPCRHPDGIEYVFVNGQPALAAGNESGWLSGQVLRKKAH